MCSTEDEFLASQRQRVFSYFHIKKTKSASSTAEALNCKGVSNLRLLDHHDWEFKAFRGWAVEARNISYDAQESPHKDLLWSKMLTM